MVGYGFTSSPPAMIMEPPPVPPAPAADPRTGLVLRLSQHDMPATRNTWRHPVAIAYEEEGSHDSTDSTEAAVTRIRTPAPRNDAMPPGGATSVLLHSCCAPCSGAMAGAPEPKLYKILLFYPSPVCPCVSRTPLTSASPSAGAAPRDV